LDRSLGKNVITSVRQRDREPDLLLTCPVVAIVDCVVRSEESEIHIVVQLLALSQRRPCLAVHAWLGEHGLDVGTMTAFSALPAPTPVATLARPQVSASGLSWCLLSSNTQKS
jgi:hypothetical protein